MSNTPGQLAYQRFSSILSPGFWQQLTDIKINKLKLDKRPINIRGTYSIGLSSNLPCLASFDHGSLGEDTNIENKTTISMHGSLVILNLYDELVVYKKDEFCDQIGAHIWQSILDGTALQDPEKHLTKFGLLVYADLKKFKFVYWFVFPALHIPSNVSLIDHDQDKPEQQPIESKFSEKAIKSIQQQYDAPSNSRSFKRGFFIVAHDGVKDEVVCLALTRYKDIAESYSGYKVYFAFSDPCPSKLYPGWPLRNYIALIATQFKLDNISIIRIRRGQQTAELKSEFSHSYVLNVKYDIRELSKYNHIQRPHATGWELSESGHAHPRKVDLSKLLDPTKLVDSAVNLNLKLMKWRLVPSLNLERIANTRCLLLGCGTLGCHIARGLLAWGVKHLSLVDNSKVSHSNPVRQSLYTFEDCLRKEAGSSDSGLYKSHAAAASLRKIHPTVHVESHVLSIPIPDHPLSSDEFEQVEKVVAKLEELIGDHDVVFLLTDTRESRWLPTVIAMSKQKLVINAAIGFDTYLLQRFGIRQYTDEVISYKDDKTTTESNKNDQNQLDSSSLGCYFCNDIVAPGDSSFGKTFDQQCTVSRPGVSMMVSALAVEFLASILSSPRGSRAPAFQEIHDDLLTLNEEDLGSDLGIVPHSIRGNLSRYHMYMPTSPRFNRCSACSIPVVSRYMKEGFEFLGNVFNQGSYLEDVAGLMALKVVNDDVLTMDSDDDLS